MYVWRLPLFSFAILASTAAVVCALVVVLHLRGRTRIPIIRGIFSAIAVLTVIAGPVLTSMMIRRPLAEASRHGLYIDPPFFVFWIPAVVATLLIVAARLLFPSAAGRDGTAKYRAGFVAMLLLFALLNCANWCSPGWCERYGFPFPYSWWSDAMLVMAGKNLTAGFSRIAIFLDIAVAAAASWALAAYYRRSISRL